MGATRRSWPYTHVWRRLLELEAHADAEEKVFYPVVRDEVDRKLADEGEEEHGEARQLIGRLSELGEEFSAAKS